MSAYRHYAVALYVVGAVALGGCSALGRVTALHSEPDKEGWVARPPIPERSHPAFMRYEFAHDTGTVSTCSLQTRMSIVGFGPPLIPIVPGALFPYTSFDPSTEYNTDDLFFYVQINSPEGRPESISQRLRCEQTVRVHPQGSEVFCDMATTNVGRTFVDDIFMIRVKSYPGNRR